MFWRTASPSSLGPSSPESHSEYEGTVLLWNVANYTCSEIVSHTRRLASSAALLREPQILHDSSFMVQITNHHHARNHMLQVAVCVQCCNVVIDIGLMCSLSVYVFSDSVACLSMSATQRVSQHQKHLHPSVTMNQQLWWQLRCLMTMNMKGDGVLSGLLEPLLHEGEEIWVGDEGSFTRVPKCQWKIQMEGDPQRWVVLW